MSLSTSSNKSRRAREILNVVMISMLPCKIGSKSPGWTAFGSCFNLKTLLQNKEACKVVQGNYSHNKNFGISLLLKFLNVVSQFNPLGPLWSF
jgi:hypothetical protein